jgi:hypothetical protein
VYPVLWLQMAQDLHFFPPTVAEHVLKLPDEFTVAFFVCFLDGVVVVDVAGLVAGVVVGVDAGRAPPTLMQIFGIV